MPLHLRGLFAGAVTPFLPCGWLYLFALVAAGTGSALYGGTVMAAFWLGTVPALTVLIAGVHQLSVRFRRIVPIAAALLLIASGGTTFAGRGFAALDGMGLSKLTQSAAEIGKQQTISSEDLLSQELPCCQEITEPTASCCQEGP